MRLRVGNDAMPTAKTVDRYVWFINLLKNSFQLYLDVPAQPARAGDGPMLAIFLRDRPNAMTCPLIQSREHARGIKPEFGSKQFVGMRSL